MFDFNDVKLTGHLGKDADIKKVASSDGESTVINFRMARNRGPKERQTTDWFPVVYWPRTERQTEFLREKLTSGAGVLVQGELRTRSYTDNSGVDRDVTEIHAWDVQVDLKPKANPEAKPEAPAQSAASSTPGPTLPATPATPAPAAPQASDSHSPPKPVAMF